MQPNYRAFAEEGSSDTPILSRSTASDGSNPVGSPRLSRRQHRFESGSKPFQSLKRLRAIGVPVVSRRVGRSRAGSPLTDVASNSIAHQAPNLRSQVQILSPKPICRIKNNELARFGGLFHAFPSGSNCFHQK